MIGYSPSASERHRLVSYTGSAHGIVDTLLRQKGKTRNVVATVPYYLSALATVAATDLISTVPRLLADAHASVHGLAVRDAPQAIRRFGVSVARHRRLATSALLDWVTAQLVETRSAYPAPDLALGEPLME